MVQNYKNHFYLNKFLIKTVTKKQYIQKLENKIRFLNKTHKQNYKKLNVELYTKKNNFLIAYVVEFFFSQTNTLINITNFEGKLKFFCSAGQLLFKGRSKKARTLVLKDIIYILITKLKFLRNRPITLHLKNTGFKKIWVIKKLKKKKFIKTVTGFNLYSHNGCRKKKVRRKKLK